MKKEVIKRGQNKRPQKYLQHKRLQFNDDVLMLADDLKAMPKQTPQYDFLKDKIGVLAPFYLKHVTLDMQKDIAKLRAKQVAGVTNILAIIQQGSNDEAPNRLPSKEIDSIDAEVVPDDEQGNNNE